MKEEGANWFEGLRGFVEECRGRRPIAKRDDLSAAEEMQCRIIGGSLVAWLHQEGTMCGPLFGRGGDHLWKWNGEAPTLLEECLNQWGS